MKMRLLVVLLITAIQPLCAQQWVEKKKDFSLLLKQEFRTYDQVFDIDGNRFPAPEIKHNVTTISGEYAVSDKFSVSASFPIVVRNSVKENPQFGVLDANISDPGEAIISVRYNHRFNEHLQTSAFLQQALPTANNNARFGLNTGYNDLAQYVGGTIRYSTNELFFASFDIGYRLRHKDFGDEVEALAEIGLKIKSDFWFIARSNGLQPIENGDEDKRGGNFGLYQQWQGFWDTGAGIRYNHPNWEVSALFNANFKGQYSPVTSFFLFGVKYRMLNRD